MTTFRVHFHSGETIDVDADTPQQAGKIAASREKDIRIKKIKVVRK